MDESCYDTFLEDETMSVIIRYLSRGYIREVVIDIGRSALSRTKGGGQAMLKVNGKAYDWGDVDLKIPGLNIQVQEISYDDELEIEEVYGSGSKPRGYGTGNYKASGKLSMLRDDYDDLLGLLQAKGVPFYKMELPSIIVSYANEGARTKIDELKKVKFSKRSNKAAQGDKSLTVDVDMMIVGGVYQDGVAPV